MNRIKDIREDADVKQKELAQMLNIPITTLSGWENQKYEPPFEYLIKIANIFNVSLDYILCRTNNPSNEEFTKGLTEEEIKDLQHYRDLLRIKRAVENNKKISTYENTK